MASSILHTGHDSGYQRKDILKTQHFLTSVGVPLFVQQQTFLSPLGVVLMMVTRKCRRPLHKSASWQYFAEEIFIFSGLKLLSLVKHTSYYCELY
ncbi:hypothetical protein T05_12035 [Trichinella murrelli]|uniref:Uncharacterized protein n=1 Tax=Trichinella murrelli TaxID=144512 RepID=A0A0V0TH79_9BILA|nr:hypothetical protein T05_12035 [Trichinella murrelli]